MKIIRSFVSVSACLLATTLLHAQETKTDIAKPIEVKIPALAGNKISPQPELKPQPQQAATQAASTSANKTEMQPQANEKLEAKTFNKNDIATPGGEEGKKIMAGKASKPTDPIYSPSTVDANLLHPVVKPAKGSQQQQ